MPEKRTYNEQLQDLVAEEFRQGFHQMTEAMAEDFGLKHPSLPLLLKKIEEVGWAYQTVREILWKHNMIEKTKEG